MARHSGVLWRRFHRFTRSAIRAVARRASGMFAIIQAWNMPSYSWYSSGTPSASALSLKRRASASSTSRVPANTLSAVAHRDVQPRRQQHDFLGLPSPVVAERPGEHQRERSSGRITHHDLVPRLHPSERSLAGGLDHRDGLLAVMSGREWHRTTSWR